MTLYGEGSNASSTNNAQKGAACSWVTLYGEGSKASLTNKGALESGELIPLDERELRCSEGSAILIGDPLW